MFKALAQRIARYVLRDELSILNNRVFQAECCESMALDLSEERALMCNELRKELHAADRDNAFLYEQLKELHAESVILRIDLDNGNDYAREVVEEIKGLRAENDNLRKRKEEVNRLLHCYEELYGLPF